jgi:hypothetical protein
MSSDSPADHRMSSEDLAWEFVESATLGSQSHASQRLAEEATVRGQHVPLLPSEIKDIPAGKPEAEAPQERLGGPADLAQP